MKEEEFIGNLVDISARKLVEHGSDNNYQNFFLILGLVFNDLKDLLFTRSLLKENFRHPDISEISVHMGEYSGFLSHNTRLLLATVSEFFCFLDKYKTVTTSIKFRLLLKELNKEQARTWADLMNYKKDNDSLFSRIARIRSNTVFHYDHSSKELVSGFKKCFFEKGKDLPQYNKCYYYSDQNMRTTRFFFSDAAADMYTQTLVTKKEIDEIEKVVGHINKTVRALMISYLQQSGKSIHR